MEHASTVEPPMNAESYGAVAPGASRYTNDRNYNKSENYAHVEVTRWSFTVTRTPLQMGIKFRGARGVQ